MLMLKEKNWDVTLIEKSNQVGGGVRTFYHGGHPFTYGPRHFIGPEINMPAFEFLNKIIPMRHIKKINYSHPTFNKKSVFAQSQKNKISGIKNTYFAGAYWRYGFHEDGVLSALDVCKNFGVEI